MRAIIAFAILVVISCNQGYAQSDTSKTSSYVKIDVVASKPDVDTGKQRVTITVDIDKDYYLIGNKVHEDFVLSKFRVNFKSAGSMIDADVVYPAGMVDRGGDPVRLTIYQGKIVVTATLRRKARDQSPLEVIVRMQGYPNTRIY